MRVIHPTEAAPEYVMLGWSDVGAYAMGSGNVTLGKVHPESGEVWIQKFEFSRIRYEVYESVAAYRTAVNYYRVNIERDPEHLVSANSR